MRFALALLMLMMGPAFADEVPVPTEGGGHVESEADNAAPAENSDSRPFGEDGTRPYNPADPEGPWETRDGFIGGTGDCQGTCTSGTKEAYDYDMAQGLYGAGGARSQQGGTSPSAGADRSNGGGHDR